MSWHGAHTIDDCNSSCFTMQALSTSGVSFLGSSQCRLLAANCLYTHLHQSLQLPVWCNEVTSSSYKQCYSAACHAEGYDTCRPGSERRSQKGLPAFLRTRLLPAESQSGSSQPGQLLLQKIARTAAARYVEDLDHMH